MSILEAIILGIVQGLTEFLPVSSSGHLVLANYYLGFGDGTGELPLAVDIATNTGTLLAVLLLLHKDVIAALTGFFSGLTSAEARKGEGWRMALLLLVASVPTGLIGLFLKDYFEVFNAPLPVAIALAVTGLILWVTPRSGQKTSVKSVTFLDAIIVGIAQGLAVIPGISRSGTSIATLLGRNFDGTLAARFSFLLYVIASLGVALLGVTEIPGSGIGVGAFLAMTVASFAVGYIALRWLFSLLRRGQFRVFSPYLWAVSLITIVSLFLR